MVATNRMLKYWGLAGIIFCLALIFYFSGPASELTLISRLHYNAVFNLTPCMGMRKNYDDGVISFSYPVPPAILNRTPPVFISPFQSKRESEALGAYIEVDAQLKPSYRYPAPAYIETQAPAEPRLKAILRSSGAEPVKMELRKSSAFVRKEGAFGGEGDNEFLYVLGKNGYIYRLAMPRYPSRKHNGLWLVQALYNSGLLSRDYYTDQPQPQGFWKWFLTPGADKQAYCAGNALKETLEVKD